MLLSEIQCSFLEQEINWGPHDFQLRTFFGLDSIDDPPAMVTDFLCVTLRRALMNINQVNPLIVL